MGHRHKCWGRGKLLVLLSVSHRPANPRTTEQQRPSTVQPVLYSGHHMYSTHHWTHSGCDDHPSVRTLIPVFLSTNFMFNSISTQLLYTYCVAGDRRKNETGDQHFNLKHVPASKQQKDNILLVKNSDKNSDLWYRVTQRLASVRH